MCINKWIFCTMYVYLHSIGVKCTSSSNDPIDGYNHMTPFYVLHVHYEVLCFALKPITMSYCIRFHSPDLEFGGFYTVDWFVSVGESFAVTRVMELAFTSMKTALSAYHIDFHFCLISSFLTKVIRKPPNLDHKMLLHL